MLTDLCYSIYVKGKLTEKGYITDRVEIIGKRQRMSRVYYSLTPAGEE